MSHVRAGFPGVALLFVVLLSGACSPQPVSGRYQCKPNRPGTCPPGWYCQLASREDPTYRCYAAPHPVCGNGVAEEGEECDGQDLRGESCRTRGYAGGQLRCREDCTLSAAGCVPSLCGNGVLEQGEACDGTDLGGTTCEGAGFGPGNAACYRNCTLDLSDCERLPTCGDGVVEGSEQCEPGQPVGSCQELGFPGGILGCNENCSLDTSGCVLAVCGNGVAEQDVRTWEDCDGSDLRGASCQDLGYPGGDLACNDDCTYDTSGCLVPVTCGNGVREGLEQCDGQDFSGMTCRDLGFSGGELSCTEQCAYDLSGCERSGPVCGNGILEDGEACDGRQLSIESCRDLGFEGGVLRCDCNCEFDTSTCTCPPGTVHIDNGCVVGSPPESCGNGRRQTGEQCDGQDLGEATCESLGYGPGTLRCSETCSYDVSGCGAATGCGNGMVEPGEECDGTDLNGARCESLGYGPGTLRCSETCSYDVSGCGAATGCGNGMVEPGEDCDGTDLNGESCASLGLGIGILRCASDCAYDTSLCGAGFCGDGVRSGDEECDGADLPNSSCSDFVPSLGAGQVTCRENCTYDTSGCTGPASGTCGNGIREGDEECDGTDLDGESCASLGLGTGFLRCHENCTFDTTGCVGHAVCGNGVAEGGEECDGLDLKGLDCGALGLGSGSLGCTANCTLETSACAGPVSGVCGNWEAEGDEECDGLDLRGQTCRGLGLGSGFLQCFSNCTLNTNDCQGRTVCGNGVAEGGEECDGTDLRGMDCERLGFSGGVLSCSPNCTLDASACINSDPSCGNNVVDPAEPCDPSVADLLDCRGYGYDFGTAVCRTNCTLDLSGCGLLEGCGDGSIGAGEDCDGTNLGGATCEYLGFGSGGELRCTPYCEYDTSGCMPGDCGNGFVEQGEECDGAALNSQTCETLGYAGGTLRCTAQCRFDTSGCWGRCGDGVREGQEACDGTDLNQRECADLGLTGSGLACNDNCTFDTSACGPAQGVPCGNGMVESGEDCDGTDLAGKTCAALGLGTGFLACNDNCTFDTSGCHGQAICGNGVPEAGEECDGAFTTTTCAALGLSGGTVGCLPNCLWDRASCSPGAGFCGDGTLEAGEDCESQDATMPCWLLGQGRGHAECRNCLWDRSSCDGQVTCGNGVAEGQEECDGSDLAGRSCTDLGFSGGSLRCGPDCRFDVSGCTGLSPDCGNGAFNPGEECDGQDLGGMSCVLLGYAGGTLACTSECRFEFSGCWYPANCGNGTLDPGEDCEPDLPVTKTCEDLGQGSGTLACGWDCKWDVSSCTTKVCGNGIKEDGESCDGLDFGLGQDCTTHGFDGGQLTCSGDCSAVLTDHCWTSGDGYCDFEDGEDEVSSPGDCSWNSVAVGWGHVCAGLTGGDVFCWGANTRGQVGPATLDATVYRPVRVQWFQVANEVSAGHEHSCAAAGPPGDPNPVKCWGAGTLHQLGDGQGTDSASPVAVAGLPGDVDGVASAGENACTRVYLDGSLWCWGDNSRGQLGVGDTTVYATPVQVRFGVGLEATAYDVGPGFACAVAGDPFAVAGDVYCWGQDDFGQVGDGGGPDVLLPAQVTLSASAITVATGAFHACAVKDGYQAVFCWGANDLGQLGRGSTSGTPEPPGQVSGVPPSGTDVYFVVAGRAHTCAAISGPVDVIYCWGDNSSGQLGTGTAGGFSATPQEVLGLPSGLNLLGMSAEMDTTCVLYGDSYGGPPELWCWGSNAHGQLGSAAGTEQPTPLELTLSGWQQ